MKPTRDEALAALTEWEADHGITGNEADRLLHYGQPLPEGLAKADARRGAELYADLDAARKRERRQADLAQAERDEAFRDDIGIAGQDG